jgi:Bacteriophage tail sheath protein
VEIFGNGGAVAGMLSRTGEVVSAAIASPEPEPLLRASVRLARDVDRVDRARLASNGINVLSAVRSPERDRPAMRTLACGASTSADWAYLAQRRLALFIVNAIERGTRWAVVAPRDRLVWERVASQVREFLEDLRNAGAFAAAPPDQAYLVICDERINDDAEGAQGVVNILVQFAASHAGERHGFMITHSVRGATVRTVSLNRLEASLIVSHDLEQEITIRLHADDDPVAKPAARG